ncbi:MAG: ABC transporter permease [Dehalococcoidales bacterium]|jgi:ABC-type dipeptide/oligopeptide/nickel transport system permease subunit
MTVAVETPPRVTEFRRTIRVMFDRPVVVAGAVVVLLVVFIAIFAPFIAPYPYNNQDLHATLQPPSGAHWLGTDTLGRDDLTQLIYGSRVSLLVGIVAVSLAGAVGMTLGLISGYFGGWIGNIIMRVIDALLALPPMILMLAIAAMLGGGLRTVLISIGVAMMPTYCRLMNGQVISLKQNDYITASRAGGAGSARIMFSHLLPNSFPPLMVLLSVNLGTAILMEAGLSYLGIGILPPTPTWGNMVNAGQQSLLYHPQLAIAPGVAVMLLVLAFNMVGDGLRDALDPRLRGTI